MGLHASRQRLYVSTQYQVWRFENCLPTGQIFQGHDRCYVPQVAWTTGDIDVHDIGIDSNEQPIFVNTLFSCLATVSNSHSFKPVWNPPFISQLAAEDRCHLNGLAMVDGEARFVTCVGQSDLADGWRDQRTQGGCIVDVKHNEVIVDGLSMPHSPRWHQNRLWVLDSGNGKFGFLDQETARFEPICSCPGYARGMSFIGNFAVVGLSRPRRDKTFSELALDQLLADSSTKAQCGLLVIDLSTGEPVHWLRISGTIEELYDVAVIPDVTRPMAIGLQNDEINRLITIHN